MSHAAPPARKFTLNDLRAARISGIPVPLLTCYDYTTARHMHAAGVPAILVGDSAAAVILGHDSTLPVTLPFLIELTAAVRRGHPDCFLIADMPFGSYHASTEQGIRNILKMAQRSGCDAVKLEVTDLHLPVIERAAAAGVAVIAHLGLRPQAAAVLGGYKLQARTESEQDELVAMAKRCQTAGAVAVLLEVVPSGAAARVVEALDIPVIGCGAGPACHGHVVVLQDLLGLTPHRPRFVPDEHDLARPLQASFRHWVESVRSRTYPGPQHEYRPGLNPKGISANQ